MGTQGPPIEVPSRGTQPAVEAGLKPAHSERTHTIDHVPRWVVCDMEDQYSCMVVQHPVSTQSKIDTH